MLILKQLRLEINPLDATLTKNIGGGGAWSYPHYRYVASTYLLYLPLISELERGKITAGFCLLLHFNRTSRLGRDFQSWIPPRSGLSIQDPDLARTTDRIFSPVWELPSVPAAADADSAWQCSNGRCRTASRCKSPALPYPRFPPAPFRPCEFQAETL